MLVLPTGGITSYRPVCGASLFERTALRAGPIQGEFNDEIQM